MPPNLTFAILRPPASKVWRISPGMPRHIALIAVSRYRIGDDRLAQRNSAVVRRNFEVAKYFEAEVPQPWNHSFQEIGILKRAAAQADLVDSVRVAQPAANFDDNGDHRVVKFGRDDAERLVLFYIMDDAHDSGPKINLITRPRMDFEPIGRFDPGPCGRFQFHRGLSLIAHLLAQSQDRSDGIEQAAAGGSRERIDAPPNHNLDGLEIRCVDRV